ncbi:MAG: hypothetical protein QOG67_3648 [Verrucomicrobiota bacterium]|jgi:glyoxylase-like metal-dependent hydrolase (beta-lactamase superfamily II)
MPAINLDQVKWIYGARDCSHSTDPLLQVIAFDEDTSVLRQSKCFNFEGNFMYLLFGTERAVLLDTGASPGPNAHDQVLPLRRAVDDLFAQRNALPENYELIVAHTHSHGDHVYWDSDFESRSRTSIVGHGVPDVMAFFGLPNWPEGEAFLDLGARRLTIFPIPGHEAAHIAVYDQRTEILLTGDSLYPGLLTIRNWAAFRRSAARLAAFSDQHPVSVVLGAHIEMKKIARELYPIGTTYQPEEHSLPLRTTHIKELNAACERMADRPHEDVHDEFVIGEPEA